MWIIYGLIASITVSFQAVFIKKIVSRMSPVLAGSTIFLGAIPFLLFLIPLMPIGSIGPNFWWALLGTSVLNVIGHSIFFYVNSKEDVSFLAPFAAINPALTMAISILTLGEHPKVLDILGVLCIVVGTMFLEKKKGKSQFESLALLIKKRNVQLVLFAYILWAISPTFEKTAVLSTQNNNPLALMFGISTLTGLGIMAVGWKSDKHPIVSYVKNFKLIAILGATSAVIQLTAYQAFSQAPLGPATAVFRTSMIFSVIFARFMLGEKDASARLGATLLMFAGVVLLML